MVRIGIILIVCLVAELLAFQFGQYIAKDNEMWWYGGAAQISKFFSYKLFQLTPLGDYPWNTLVLSFVVDTDSIVFVGIRWDFLVVPEFWTDWHTTIRIGANFGHLMMALNIAKSLYVDVVWWF